MDDKEFITTVDKDGFLLLRVRLDPSDANMEVVVTVRPVDSRRGSPQDILDAIRRAPSVDREDVDEMERLIAAGALPVIDRGIFDDDAETGTDASTSGGGEGE